MNQSYKLVCSVILIFWVFMSFRLSGFATVRSAGHQQPSVNLVVTPEADTYVLSGSPAVAWPKNRTVLWVGYNSATAIQAERSLFKFDLAALPLTSTVKSAIFSLYLFQARPTNDSPLIVTAHRLGGTWFDTISWNDYLKLGEISEPNVGIPVSTQPGWQQWELKELVRHWLQDANRTNAFSFVLRGNEASGNHERTFWSRECSTPECGSNRPKLEIQYNLPTPTPTNTPIPTPTATPTPTPLPGIAAIHLASQPTRTLNRGEPLTYTITYQVLDYPGVERAFALSNVVITNAVPANVVVISGSIGSDLPANVVVTGNVIRWTLKDPLAENTGGRVFYRVQRPPPPLGVSQGLTISKAGPPTTQPGFAITYRLVVKNLTNTVATNLVITDRLPLFATPIAAGGGDARRIENGIATWNKASLEPGQSLTITLLVEANRTLVNEEYGVRAAAGLSAQGGQAIVTTIGGTTLPPLVPLIENQGAWVTWTYTDNNGGEKSGGPLISNSTYNPLHQLYFALIVRQ